MTFDEWWEQDIMKSGDLLGKTIGQFSLSIAQTCAHMAETAFAQGRRAERERVLDEVVEILDEEKVSMYKASASGPMRFSLTVFNRIVAMRDVEAKP